MRANHERGSQIPDADCLIRPDNFRGAWRRVCATLSEQSLHLTEEAFGTVVLPKRHGSSKGLALE